MEIADRVVLVTGASSGIGAAFARMAAAAGARVAVAARRTERLEALAAELPDVFPVTTDLRDPGQVRRMVEATAEHFGSIDVLVNNAGQGLHVPIQEVRIDDLQAVIELNLYAPLVAMQAVLPEMCARGEGSIVNVSSGTTRMILPGVGPYSASKCALNQVSLTARAELEHDGIVVSVVYPSVTATEFHASLRAGVVRGGGRVVPNPPEDVAEAIMQAIRTGEAEIVVPPKFAEEEGLGSG